jgi:hypothetical protein
MAGFPGFFAGSVRSAGSNGTRGLAGKATGILPRSARSQLPATMAGALYNRITIPSRRD